MIALGNRRKPCHALSHAESIAKDALAGKTTTKGNHMSEEIKVKPRQGLSEAAFRRYERWIGQATKGSVMIKPWELIPPVKASSFVVGIRDAIRSYKINGWSSREIPLGFAIERLKVKELTNDCVLIENTYADRVNQTRKAETEQSLLLDENGIIVYNAYAKANPIRQEIRINFEDADKLVEVCTQMQAKKTGEFDYGIAVIVETNGEQEDEAIREVGKTYSNVASEKVGTRWWRLYN